MKQTNSSFLSCLNLAVTDKFLNTRVLCLDLFIRNENVCSNQTTTATMATVIKNADEPIKLIETQ